MDTESHENESISETEEPAAPEPADKEAEAPSEEDSTDQDEADDEDTPAEDPEENTNAKPVDWAKVVDIKVEYSLERAREKAKELGLNIPKGFDPAKGLDLIIPMQVPDFETVVVDGKIQLKDEEFDLANYLAGGKPEATNSAQARGENETSNEVKTKLDELVLEAHKLWQKDGQLLKGEQLKDLPQVGFEIHQIAIKVKVDKDGKPIQGSYSGQDVSVNKDFGSLILNHDNSYRALVRDLPSTYENLKYTIAQDGTSEINTDESYVIFYRYELVEKPIKDWHSEKIALEVDLPGSEGDQVNASVKLGGQDLGSGHRLAFEIDENGKLVIPSTDPYSPIQMISNTYKPEKPPTPPETPDTADEPHTPPDTPDNPPTTPPEMPKISNPPQLPPASTGNPPPIISKAFILRLPKTAAVQASWQTEDKDKKTQTESLRDRKEPESADRPRALGEAQDLVA